MREFVKRHLTAIEWLLGTLAVVLPVAAWFSRNDLNNLTLYDVFPPLGLIAFGVMWTHFVIGALRRYAVVQQRKSNLYAPISMGLVLALILLHPGLFYLALYLDGYGLPPQSYIEAYSTQLLFIALGTVALFIFLSYELKRWFGDKPWWIVIERIQIVAMIAIFIHGLGLGNEIRIDWFMLVWIFYGLTLLLSVGYTWIFDRNSQVTSKNS